MKHFTSSSALSKKHFLGTKTFLILLGCCMLTVSLFLWKAQESRNISQLHLQTESKAVSISREIEIRYRGMFNTLNRIANKGFPNLLQSIDEWEHDAVFSIESFAGIQSIAWVDNELFIRMIVPGEENKIYIDQKVHNATLNTKNIYIWVPIYKGTDLEGFILGTINIEMLISPLITETQNDYMLRLTRQGEILLSTENWENSNDEFVVNQVMSLQNSIVLDLSLAPMDEFRNSEIDTATRTLMFSLLFSFIAIIAVYFAQKNYALSRLNVYQFRELLEKVELAAVTLDTEARITFCNDYVLKLTGYKREDVMGQNWFTRFAPHTPEKERNSFLDELARDDLGPRGELLIYTRTGEPRYLAINNSVLRDTRGNIVGVAGIGEDITQHMALEAENKRLTEQFYQAQKMDSLGKLAGGIAHDFNNLLVPILGYAELGLMEADPESSHYTQLEHIQEAGTRAANLTRQILAFSRQQVLELRTLNLNQVVTDFQKMLQPLIGEDIKLQTLLAEDLWMIKADEGQLEQVLMNLSINARDAMPRGGILTIKSVNISLGKSKAKKLELNPGLYILLTVSDNGHGMDADTQRRIFEPFFTSKTRDKGTGLGLSTVFGIIKQHSGSILVSSKLDQGTTFKIYFPKTDAPVVSNGSIDSENTMLQGTETILVVEDETNVRLLVCETLQSHGYTVLLAAEPAAGLVQADTYQDTIHLLLTDVIMPRMNGSELYNQLSIIRPDIKVLYMSGYTDNKISQEGILKRDAAFIQKPFSINGLLKKVRAVLD